MLIPISYSVTVYKDSSGSGFYANFWPLTSCHVKHVIDQANLSAAFLTAIYWTLKTCQHMIDHIFQVNPATIDLILLTSNW